ncbi:uncharacterized protein [Setaria viridis]|uniref:uncharacterized protein isoform X2 n=1 Tax=Setaria viridis TaxID=4556 RepID=UPI003B3BCB24
MVGRTRAPGSLRIVESAPPPIITFEEGQDPEVVAEVVKETEAAAGAVPPEVPVSGEVVMVEDGPEPPATEVNPAGTEVSAQEEGRTTMAGGSQDVPQHASPRDPAPTIKPLHWVGKPSLKLQRSARISSRLGLGLSGSRSTTDDASCSVEDVAPAPTVALAEGDSAPAVKTGAASLVATLMHDIIDSMVDNAVPSLEPTVPGALPMDILVESPSPPMIMEANPLNAAAPEAPKLEAA